MRQNQQFSRLAPEVQPVPSWSEVLRALREATGTTQAGWATRLGYGRRTVQRWEHGELAPDAAATEALIRLCSEQTLLRDYDRGPLQGLHVTDQWLRSLLGDARMAREGVANQGRQLPPTPPKPLLRMPLTSFVGRERERAELRQLLMTHRLLTLTGAGGIGKTRLALELATEASDDFADGVILVDLAGLSSPELVAPAIARSLGLRLGSGRPVADILSAGIGTTSVLLVLDNFEHVAAAALDVAELLHACPNLKVIATSRAPLHVTSEQEVPVPPLEWPQAPWPPTEQLLQYDAVKLFLARARAVKPDFELTGSAAVAVAQICARLDGLPLSIELTAPQIRLLQLPALLQRLDRRLKLLVGGAGDRPPRHQTLRATIDWSYNLLSPELCGVFRRLGVFAGSWTLEAAAAVCNLTDAVDALRTLVEQSVIRQAAAQGQEARFAMLETVREYALEQLLSEAEVDETQRAHAQYFLELCETAEPRMIAGPHRAAWLRRLEPDEDNLLAAMRWCFEGEQVERGLRLGAAASHYWFYLGSLNQWREWRYMVTGLAERGGEPAFRARALNGCGLLAYGEGDYSTAERLHRESLVIGRQQRDPRLIAAALHHLGRVASRIGAPAEALQFLEESLRLWRRLGERSHESVDLTLMGGVLVLQGDFGAAYARWAESAALCRELADKTGTAEALSWQAFAAQQLGDTVAAETLCEEALALAREDENRRSIAWCLLNVALVRLTLGDHPAARSACLESVRLRDDTDEAQTRVALALKLLAGIAAETGQPSRALRLFGAAAAIPATRRTRFAMLGHALHPWQATAARALGEAAAAAALHQGRGLTADQALAYAFADDPGAELHGLRGPPR